MKLAMCVATQDQLDHWLVITWGTAPGLPKPGATYEITHEWTCGARTPMVDGPRLPSSIPTPCACEGGTRGWPRRWFRFLNDPDFKEDEAHGDKRQTQPKTATV